MKIGFVSLGCSKNLVDTEVMLKRLADAGYTKQDILTYVKEYNRRPSSEIPRAAIGNHHARRDRGGHHCRQHLRLYPKRQGRGD